MGTDGAHAFRIAPDADAFAWLAGRPTSLSEVVAESRALRARGVPVHWEIPLCEALVHRQEALFSLAFEEGVLSRLLSPHARLGADARRFAWDFVRYRLLEGDAPRLPDDELARYEELERTLAAPDGPRLAPVRTLRERVAELFEVLRDGSRAVVQRVLASAARPGGAVRPDAWSRVLLIGAYGGDHIGDTAILGGVLERLRAGQQTRSVVLMSQRPDHTRHLVSMLATPVAVRVEEYTHERVRACLPEADAVVFAGGPLTDIPKQLVRHLYTASLAKRSRRPFRIEGVGVGPFTRWPSAWVARRLARMADRVSVRTGEDARQPQVAGVSPEVGHDPAFDYLATRGDDLTKLRDADRAWLERLLADTAGRPVVGINTRPIEALFTVGGGDASNRTRSVEERFHAELAEGLRRFDAGRTPRPCFVFLPMNAIQFGRSDLSSAWRIARLLATDVDLRVWEGDPSIDGVVALLRRLDAAITMRFHATVFALSQQLPVIGIDYRPGAKDKVGYLLEDAGRSADCTRIDQLSAGWLRDRLAAAIDGAQHGAQA